MSDIRHDWQLDEILVFFGMPFNDLLLKAHLLYREFFKEGELQFSSLLNIKTGGCPENCRYCAQSAHYKTDLQKEKLMDIDVIRSSIKKVKKTGATRFCFAAAWRNLNDRDIDYICSIIREIKNEGMESCASLGMITLEQAQQLKNAGLDFYNHNIDTSRDFYENIVTTRTYDDRLQSISNIQKSGINVCSGGIVGMGESVEDRAQMLLTLANLKEHPLSVPINRLMPIPGTPLAESQGIDNIDFVRVIAIARILMPASYIRLAAGRDSMSTEMQALCLFAGANSIFLGEKLLTTANPDCDTDRAMLKKLGYENCKIYS